MDHSEEDAVEAGWGPAFDHLLTGLILAIGLSVLVVLCAGRAPWVGEAIREIEDHGIDATMRFRADIGRVTPIGDENLATRSDSRSPPPAGYLFIDLDEDTCLAAHGDERCRLRSPASAAAAAQVASALLAAHPRLVILDVRLWDMESNVEISPELEALMKALPGDVPVLAPAPASPTGAPGKVFIDWSQAPTPLRASRIHFAPALVWPDRADGMDRRYSESVAADIFYAAREKKEPVRDQTLLTLPYLAALYATTPARNWDEVDCHASNAPQVCDPLAQSGERQPEPRRIHFTLHRADDDASIPTRNAARLYSRITSSQAITQAGVLRLDPDWITDKVVIVGFNGPSGLDRHSTPLGEMSGAELILNAIRSFASGAALDSEDEPSAVLRETTAAIVSSGPFLIFWRIQGGLWRWARRRGRPKQVLAGLAIAIVFGGAIYLSALLTTGFVLLFWSGAMAKGAPVDALLPVAVLALESFAHAAKQAIDVSHQWVSAYRHRLQTRFSNAKELPHEPLA